MRQGRPTNTARAIRQDLSFTVSLLLLLSVVLSALTGLSSDEAEFFGLGDDLHVLVGWSMIVLTLLHTVLHAGQMVNYAKRRLRRHLGVGSVVLTSAEYGRKPEPGEDRRNVDRNSGE
jgi:Mn2+/Fe2+ NRAMP family transporter